MKAHRLFGQTILALHICVQSSNAQYVEPRGGLYPTKLIFFQDTVTKGFQSQAWGGSETLDARVLRGGRPSWRWDMKNYGGVQLLWGGWGNDTTCFWVHENSHLSFWIMPSSDRIKFQVQLGTPNGMYDVIGSQEVGERSVWKYYDVLVPMSVLRRPLNVLKFMFSDIGSGGGVLYVQDIILSDVRLYAGKGDQGSIGGIFADQVGYDTYGYKTFSAEEYESFQIIRTNDKKVMYTGNNRRIVTSKAVADRTTYIGDFTKFETPGNYFIQLNNGRQSYPFEISPNVYDAPLRAALRFFYYQRHNSAIEMPYAEGPWVRQKDEKELVDLPRSMGGTKYIRKGWHDAGDLSIYMQSHGHACYWLASAWEDFPFDSDKLNIPESGNNTPDILDELRWGLDWILDMQDTTDGAFFHNMCVRKSSPYEYGRATPLTITGYELTNKTTSATAVATGVLAYASRVFTSAKLDPMYARMMKNAALKGWAWLETHPQQIMITENCSMNQDDSDIHARFFAAAALFLLTGEDKYNRYFLANDPGSSWISDYNNQTNLAYLLYLKSPRGNSKKQSELRNLLTGRAQEATADRNKHPFGFVGYYYWGSLATSYARVGNYNILDWQINRNIQSIYTVQQQVHYTFGQNSLGFVYLSGFGVNGMRNPYHHWLKVLNATPHAFPGMLAGGPNENPDPNDISYPPRVYGYWGDPKFPRNADTPIDQRYTDNDSWSTNEVAVNQNAQLVYVLCAARSYAKKGK